MSQLQEHDAFMSAAARKREQAKRCHELLRDLENAQAIAILSGYARELEEAAALLEERARYYAKDVA